MLGRRCALSIIRDGQGVVMTQDIQRTAVVAIFDKDFHSGQHPNGCLGSKQFFVLVHGTAEMIVHARAVLGTTGSSHLRTLVSSRGSHVVTGLGMG